MVEDIIMGIGGALLIYGILWVIFELLKGMCSGLVTVVGEFIEALAKSRNRRPPRWPE